MRRSTSADTEDGCGKPDPTGADVVLGPAWLLGCGVLLAQWLYLVWAPLERLNLFVQDDAYYYLLVARNWVRLGVPSFDGLTPTNGFQPLWQLMTLLPALAPDRLSSLRLMLLLGALLFQIGVFCFALSLSRCLPGVRAHWVLLVLEAQVFLTWAFALNGMESSLNVALLGALALLLTSRTALEGRRGMTLLALLAALLGVTRLDGLAYIAPLAVLIALKRRRLAPALAFSAAAALPAAAFVLVNLVATGAPFPVSGDVKKIVNTRAVADHGGEVSGRVRLATAGAMRLGAGVLSRSIGGYVTFAGRILGVPYRWLSFPAALLALIGVLFAALLLARNVDSAILRVVAVLSAASAIRMTFFAWSFPAEFHLFDWYWAGEVLLILVLILAALPTWFWRRGVLAGVAAVGLLNLAAFFVLDENRAHARSVEDAMRFLRSRMDTETAIGSWDAGYVAFLHPGPVANLDGLISSRDYFRDVIAGGTAVDRYLRDRGIEWIVNETTATPIDAARGYRGLSPGSFEVVYTTPVYRAPFDALRSCAVLRLVPER